MELASVPPTPKSSSRESGKVAGFLDILWVAGDIGQ
jgi:hypothetical protein